MTKNLNLLNLYDTYGFRRLLEMEVKRPCSKKEAIKFRKWLYSNGKDYKDIKNPYTWLKNKTLEYTS